jgi:hypothetical protein
MFRLPENEILRTFEPERERERHTHTKLWRLSESVLEMRTEKIIKDGVLLFS